MSKPQILIPFLSSVLLITDIYQIQILLGYFSVEQCVVEVEKIVDINNTEMSMEIRFNLIIEWLDHNVKWMNLKAGQQFNILSPEEIDKLWMSKVLFKNSDWIDPIIKDSSAVISVRRQVLLLMLLLLLLLLLLSVLPFLLLLLLLIPVLNLLSFYCYYYFSPCHYC